MKRGKRDVTIPPHVMPAVTAHFAAMDSDSNALLFPATTDRPNPPPAGLRGCSSISTEPAAPRGRPDLRFHDLRHTGAVYATRAGASLAEVMARLGHSTTAAAMRYQHAARGRDAQIADALSQLANRLPPNRSTDVDAGDVP